MSVSHVTMGTVACRFSLFSSLLLVHEMLGHSQVFQVSPGELGVCNDFDLPFTLLANLDRVAQISYAIVDLDLVVQELLKGRNVEDLVRGGLGGVDDEL